MTRKSIAVELVWTEERLVGAEVELEARAVRQGLTVATT